MTEWMDEWTDGWTMCSHTFDFGLVVGNSIGFNFSYISARFVRIALCYNTLIIQ